MTPNLENSGFLIFQIVFRMHNADSGMYHLNIGCHSPGFVTKLIRVGDRPFADIRDDLHVLVRMRIETALRHRAMRKARRQPYSPLRSGLLVQPTSFDVIVATCLP